MSDNDHSNDSRAADAFAHAAGERRPSSWISQTDLRQRARRRKMIYLCMAGIGMLVFVVLIYLLLERTRWTAGGSPRASIIHGEPWGHAHRS